jgi:hypothetical protein
MTSPPQNWDFMHGKPKISYIEVAEYLYSLHFFLLQAAHVAAQYGQTALLYHIAVKWGCEVDAVDNDGRSPLHW